MKKMLYLCINNLTFILIQNGDRFSEQQLSWDKYNY